MSPVFLLIDELLGMLPGLVQAGISVAQLIQKISDVLSATAAPDDPTWVDLDQRCSEAKAAFLSAAAPPPAPA